MKIKMIGTGAIAGMRRSACCLIDKTILVDCGNGIVKTLLQQGVDIQKIKVVLVTHLHGDHIFDLPFFILQRRITGNNEDCIIYGPVGLKKSLNVLLEIGFSDSKYMSWYEDANVRVCEFEELDEKIAKYEVKSYLVDHGKCVPAYGFTVSDGEKCVGISGDTCSCSGVDEIIKTSDIFLVDATKIEGNSQHMGVYELEELARKYGKNIVPTHMNYEVREYLSNHKFPGVLICEDGDEIDI